MSVYEAKIFRQNGSVMLDGSTRGGVFLEILPIPVGNTSSRSYQQAPSGALFFYTAQAGGHLITMDADATGSARINWTATDSHSNNDTILYVFTKSIVTSDLYGIVIKNQIGENQASPLYTRPQFLATVTLNGTSEGSYTTPDGYKAYTHATANLNLAPSSDKLVVMAMPDTGADDTWYCLQNESIRAGASGPLRVTVYTKAASYVVPTLHVFALNNLTPSGELWDYLLKDPIGRTTFSACAEGINIQDNLVLTYPGPGNVNAYALGSAALPGLQVPYYFRNVQSGQNQTKYFGVVRRNGSQLNLKLMLDTQVNNAITDVSYEQGSQANRYCPVVDLSYLSAGTQPGTPGGATLTAPSFTSQPASITRKPGETATFSCGASGNPAPTYQWYRNGSLVSGATGSSYSFTVAAGDNNASFTVAISNSRGSLTSNPAVLMVDTYEPPPVTPVSITSGPASQSVTAGQTANFSVTVSGTSPVSIDWYKNGYYVASGFSYSFTAQIGDNGASIYCVATNGGGAYSAVSGTATLTVTQTIPDAYIYQNPSSVTVSQGQSASMTCLATNANSYNWYRNGSYVGVGSTISLDTSTPGTFSYVCKVYGSNMNWVDSATAYLTVNATADLPYTSYTDLSGSIDIGDGETGSLDVYRDGSAYLNGIYMGRWGNGSSSGTMYVASGSGAGVALEPGSDSFGTGYRFSDVGSVSFIFSGGQYNGVSKKYTATVTIRLNGNAVAYVTVNISVNSAK